MYVGKAEAATSCSLDYSMTNGSSDGQSSLSTPPLKQYFACVVVGCNNVQAELQSHFQPFSS